MAWTFFCFGNIIFIAIRDLGGKYSNVKLEKLEFFDKHPVTNYVYGWKYLSKYRNWDFNIVIDMINGEYCKYIMEQVDNILEELKRKEIVL